MALRYRHDPPSFHLPEDIFKQVKKAKDSFTVYIFGYSVLFTKDKLIKLQDLPRREFRKHKFQTFQKSFFGFIDTVKKAEKESAQANFKIKKGDGPFAKPGEYDKHGAYIGPFGTMQKEYAYREALNKEIESEPEPDDMEPDDMEPDETGRDDRQSGGHGDDGGRQDWAKKAEEQGDARDHGRSDFAERMREQEQAYRTQERKPNEAGSQHTTDKERERDYFSKKRKDNDQKGESKKGKQSEKKDASKKGTHFDDDGGSQEEEGDDFVPPPPDASSRFGHFKTFDLSTLQRPKGSTETHVPVKRGDYNKVTSGIIEGPDGGYVITGPTGCGKSTVALLPLFRSPKTRVLVIEPTQANAANIEHEFANILPNLVARHPEMGTVPSVAFRAPTTAVEPLPQLIVTTTEKVLEHFDHTGALFEADYVVLDEFHLPIPTMVEMVELLRTFAVTKKYILVSATAKGFQVNPQLPAAVKAIRGVLPVGQLPPRLEGSDLDPRVFKNRSDGTYAVVPPSVTMANKLWKQYLEWNVRTFLITRETYASDYLKAVKNYLPRTAFVLEPGVEAGVTISMAVLVSMGATTAVRYDGDVVVEDTQPLDPIAGIQRGSRGGRVIPTLYIEPEAPAGVVQGSSADYYRAQAIIKMIALGAKAADLKDDGLFITFPRLKTVTRELARAALRTGGDPFISIYRHNDYGQIYVECGGDGRGFKKLARSELKLYHWPRGFYVAPITDFSQLDSQPDTFVQRSHQLLAAGAMVESIAGLSDKYELKELVDWLIAKIDIYVSDLFDLLKTIFVGSEPQRFFYRGSKSGKAPEIKDFLGPAPEVLRLFEFMSTDPVGIKYTNKVHNDGSVTSAEHSFDYKGKQLNFSFPDEYTANGAIDVEKLSRAVHSKLKYILAVEILRNGAPEKCVDLLKYKDRVPHEHIWFARVREHSS